MHCSLGHSPRSHLGDSSAPAPAPVPSSKDPALGPLPRQEIRNPATLSRYRVQYPRAIDAEYTSSVTPCNLEPGRYVNSKFVASLFNRTAACWAAQWISQSVRKPRPLCLSCPVLSCPFREQASARGFSASLSILGHSVESAPSKAKPRSGLGSSGVWPVHPFFFILPRPPCRLCDMHHPSPPSPRWMHPPPPTPDPAPCS